MTNKSYDFNFINKVNSATTEECLDNLILLMFDMSDDYPFIKKASIDQLKILVMKEILREDFYSNTDVDLMFVRIEISLKEMAILE